MTEQPYHNFKPGDKIRRKREHQDYPDWREGDRVLTFKKYSTNSKSILLLEEIEGIWDSRRFELVRAAKTTLPCIKEIPPRPASREIQDGYLYDGSCLRIHKHDHTLHLDMPYWIYHPGGNTSMYFNLDSLRKFAEALTEIVRVIEEDESNSKR